MAIKPFTFEHMLNTAGSDAKIYHALAGKNSYVIPGYGNEFAATSQGLKILIDTGWLICFGRNIQNDSIEELIVPANTTGYVTVSLDMTKENIPHGNWWDNDYTVEQNQVKLEVRQDLIWSNPSNDDQQFTFPLYSYVANDTTVNLTKFEESFNSDPHRTIIHLDAGIGSGGYWTAADEFNLGTFDSIEWVLLSWGSPTRDGASEWYTSQFTQFHKKQFMDKAAQHIPLISGYNSGVPEMASKILHWRTEGGKLLLKGDNFNSTNQFSKKLRIRKIVVLRGRWHEV